MALFNKKGQGFNLLLGGIVGFVVVAVVIVVGIQISTTLQANYLTNTAGCNSTTTAGCGAAYNSTGAVTNAYATFTSYFNILALVIIASVILYFVLRNLGGFGMG